MREPVPRLAQVGRIAPFGAQLKQQNTGSFRKLRGKKVVIGRHDKAAPSAGLAGWAPPG